MSELSEQRFLIDAVLKGHILALVRACARECGNAQAHKIGLAKQAALIPSFAVFRQLCLEDLAEAYDEDRRSPVHVTRNRKRVWLNLLRPFARIKGIGLALAINAVDHQGHYTCELVETRKPDLMGQWLRIGARLGLPEAEMVALVEREEQALRQRDANADRAQSAVN